MHAHMTTYIHVNNTRWAHTYTCMHTYSHTHIHIDTHKQMNMCKSINTYAHIYICSCTHVKTNRHAQRHADTHRHICTAHLSTVVQWSGIANIHWQICYIKGGGTLYSGAGSDWLRHLPISVYLHLNIVAVGSSQCEICLELDKRTTKIVLI